MDGQSKKDSLGNRMKLYENVNRTYLTPRTHTIIRVDGKAFHTFTRDLKRPYDVDFMADMDNTAKYLCENISGAKLAYVQSDEISVLVTDFDTLDTMTWFGGNVQKICSISASLATAKFNKLRMDRQLNEILRAEKINQADLCSMFPHILGTLAMFDSRCFSIPELTEVHNYFVWRQQDATRNSIQMLGQKHFSHSELQGVSCNDLQEKLWSERGINWNDEMVGFKRGRVIVKAQETITDPNGEPAYRTKWQIEDPPIFTQDQEFVTNQIHIPWKQL